MNIEEPSIEDSIRQAGTASSTFTWPTRTAGILARAIWTSCLSSTLFGMGYAGFVSGEFLPIPDAATAARAGIAHLRGLRWTGM